MGTEMRLKTLPYITILLYCYNIGMFLIFLIHFRVHILPSLHVMSGLLVILLALILFARVNSLNVISAEILNYLHGFRKSLKKFLLWSNFCRRSK